MVGLIYLMSFLDILTLSMMIPAIPVHLMNLGASRYMNGFLVSVNALLQLMSGPVVGSWSDTKGRKPLLIQSLSITIISNILLLSSSLYVYIASRILFGLTWHVQILLKALVIRTIPKDKQNDVFGIIGALLGLSFVIGPLLGSVLSSMDNGFFIIAVILNTFGIINWGASFFLTDIEVTNTNENVEDKSLRAELMQVFINLWNINWNVYWDVFLFKFLVESAFSAFFAGFGIILMEDLGVSPDQMGIIISVFSVSMIIANIGMGKINKRFYDDDSMGLKRNFHGFLGLLLVFICLYVYTGYWTYVFVMICVGGLRAILDMTWSAMLVERTTDSDKGTIMGSFESTMQVANLLTPLIAGYIGEMYGYVETIGLVLVFISIAVAIAGYNLVTTPYRPKVQ